MGDVIVHSKESGLLVCREQKSGSDNQRFSEIGNLDFATSQSKSLVGEIKSLPYGTDWDDYFCRKPTEGERKSIETKYNKIVAEARSLLRRLEQGIKGNSLPLKNVRCNAGPSCQELWANYELDSYRVFFGGMFLDGIPLPPVGQSVTATTITTSVGGRCDTALLIGHFDDAMATLFTSSRIFTFAPNLMTPHLNGIEKLRVRQEQRDKELEKRKSKTVDL